MANSDRSVAPKPPRGADQFIRHIVGELEADDEDLLKTYAKRSYIGGVLFVPYLLSDVSERLGVDLFGVCFALGFRGKAAREKYRVTRDYLDAYCIGRWLRSYESKVQKVQMGESAKIEAPVVQRKPKGHDDVAGLAVDSMIKVPPNWRSFLRTRRVSYKFPQPLLRSKQNQLCVGVSIAVLQSNSKLLSYVERDLRKILENTSALLSCYKFLQELPKHPQIESERLLPQLAAFCLFIYGNWTATQNVIRAHREGTSRAAWE